MLLDLIGTALTEQHITGNTSETILRTDSTDDGSCADYTFPASESLGCGSHTFTDSFGDSTNGFPGSFCKSDSTFADCLNEISPSHILNALMVIVSM